MPTITFSVSYNLREYQSFVLDYIPDGMEAMGKPRRPPSRFVRPFIMAGAAVVFFFKKRRMPVCDFAIDEQEIRRTAGGRTLVVPWRKVQRVFRYSQGYLIHMKKGAMPLPYRCFSREQADAMEELIRVHEKEA